MVRRTTATGAGIPAAGLESDAIVWLLQGGGSVAVPGRRRQVSARARGTRSRSRSCRWRGLTLVYRVSASRPRARSPAVLPSSPAAVGRGQTVRHKKRNHTEQAQAPRKRAWSGASMIAPLVLLPAACRCTIWRAHGPHLQTSNPNFSCSIATVWWLHLQADNLVNTITAWQTLCHQTLRQAPCPCRRPPPCRRSRSPACRPQRRLPSRLQLAPAP